MTDNIMLANNIYKKSLLETSECSIRMYTQLAHVTNKAVCVVF